MAEITLIMPVKNCDTSLVQSLRSIINQSLEDFELICIDDNSSDNSLQILNYHSINDKRIRVYQNKDNLMELLNRIICNASGEYILFVDSLNMLSENTLEKIYVQAKITQSDLLISSPSNERHEETFKYLSRIVGNNTFNHQKIHEIIFDVYDNPFNVLYSRDMLIDSSIRFNDNHDDHELFFYKALIKSERITYTEDKLYKTNNKPSLPEDSQFNEYIITQNSIRDFFAGQNYATEANNNKIIKTKTKYENLPFNLKKEAFKILRNDYMKILDENEQFIESLSNSNRKVFEQIIISQTPEEYELLKQVYNDKRHINFMNRYSVILKTEHQKVKNFNNSLVSSNSWKLTKIFRLI